MSEKNAEIVAWICAFVFLGFFIWMGTQIFNEVSKPTPAPAIPTSYYEVSFPNGEVYTCAVAGKMINCDYYGE